MCLYPTLVKNRKYEANKKNGGNIPPVFDKRTLYVPIGCGDCIECRNQKARGWQVRLMEEIKVNKNAHFVTLTISNEAYKAIIENQEGIEELKKIQGLEGYARDNQIATSVVRLMLERWRKQHKKSLRHFLVSELGHEGTENVHLHGIVWTDKPLTELEKVWTYKQNGKMLSMGFIWKGNEQYVRCGNGWKKQIENYVSGKTVNYIVKYITKIDEKHKNYRCKILVSPGIGKNYTDSYNAKANKYKGEHTNEAYRTADGFKISLPIYYRNKIYNDEEREKLWINKIDKGERWICGEKTDPNKDVGAFYSILKFHQEKNKKLGYGDGKRTWNELEYEKHRRNLMHEKRLGIDETTSKENCTDEPTKKSAIELFFTRRNNNNNDNNNNNNKEK